MKNKPNQSIPTKRALDPEEEALWHQVKNTVSPIEDKRQNLKHWLDLESDKNPAGVAFTAKTNISLMPKVPVREARRYPSPSYTPPVSKPKQIIEKKGLASSIDNKTARKLLKGRISIDARIDLHGMTQAVAHNVLKNFLYECHQSGYRMVLVITGKGRMSEGVLKQAVPNWLNEPPLSLYVSAFRTSHITHGGEGALYVRIRKRENPYSGH